MRLTEEAKADEQGVSLPCRAGASPLALRKGCPARSLQHPRRSRSGPQPHKNPPLQVPLSVATCWAVQKRVWGRRPRGREKWLCQKVLEVKGVADPEGSRQPACLASKGLANEKGSVGGGLWGAPQCAVMGGKVSLLVPGCLFCPPEVITSAHPAAAQTPLRWGEGWECGAPTLRFSWGSSTAGGQKGACAACAAGHRKGSCRGAVGGVLLHVPPFDGPDQRATRAVEKDFNVQRLR